MNPVDEKRIREALERANNATEGPWLQDPTETIGWWDIGTEEVQIAEASADLGDEEAKRNVIFITHARTDVPELANALLDLREKSRALAMADAEITSHVVTCGTCIPTMGIFCDTADAINSRWEAARNAVLKIVGDTPAPKGE